MVPSAPDTRLRGLHVKLGFVGLGAMGLPMARHLVEAGHDVTVASRSRGPIDTAVGFGATDGGAPQGVVAASDVTILCVPNSPDVVAVIDDALPALGAGKIVVDTSTIDPDVERAQHDARHRDRRALPRGAVVGWDCGRAEGRAHADGRWRRSDARSGSARARSLLGADRARRRTGHGPGREAVQQPHLRRADAGDGRGDGDGRARRRRPRRSSTRW